MSSPAGGAAAGASGDAGGSVQGEGGANGEAPFDAATAFSELRHSQTQQEALLRQMMGNPGAQPDGGQDDGSGDDLADGFDLSEFDDQYDGGYDEQPQDTIDLDQLAQQFGEHAAGAAQQAVQPVMAAMDELRTEQQWRDTVADHPELGDPETQQAVFDTARQLVDGGHLPPQFAFGPVGAKLIFMAQRAALMAAEEEGREEVPAAHLEGGSGASPGGQVDLGDQIIGATPGGQLGRGVLDFG